MNYQNKDFCFFSLVLGQRFCKMAADLAGDIQQYSPGTKYVILTDQPSYFRDIENVLAFKHTQQSILKCYNDKRFVLEKALSLFPVAIHVDADTRIIDRVPEDIEWEPGITVGEYRNILKLGKNSREPRLQALFKDAAAKLDVPIEEVNHIEESLYVVRRDGGKEQEFIRIWGKVARLIEMRGSHDGEGNAMGLAAAKVGWTIKEGEWERLNQVRRHCYITSHGQSSDAPQKQPGIPDKIANLIETQKRRFGYHYRLNRDRLLALQDFDFYYR